MDLDTLTEAQTMNTQLVNSLVEVVLNLSPEEQQLFQTQVQHQKVKQQIHQALAPTEQVEQLQQWLSQILKSNIKLPNKALTHESIHRNQNLFHSLYSNSKPKIFRRN
jgi:Na+/phosphate symporter